MSNNALKIWQEKKHYLEEQLAIMADGAQKFALCKQIEECERNIARLSNRAALPNIPLSIEAEPLERSQQDIELVVSYLRGTKVT